MDESQCKHQFQEAFKAGADRDYERATELLITVASACDDIPQAYLYLGRSYHALGNYGLAIHAYDDFLNRNPEHPAGNFFLGRTYLTIGMYHPAALALRKSAEREPSNPVTLSLLGLSYLKLKRPDLAVPVLAEAVQLDPENTKVYTGYLNALLTDAIRRFHVGDHDMAAQMFEFLLDAGAEGILPNLHLAVIARDRGDFQTAKSYYSRALEYDAENPAIRFQLASVLFSLGETQQAVKLLGGLDIVDDASTFSFKTDLVNRILALHHHRDGKYRDAAYFAKEVIKATGADAEMHIVMGDCYRQLGSTEKAVNHYNRAIEVEPENLQSRFGLAVTLWEGERWQDLIKILRQINRLAPGDADVTYYTALAKCELDYPPEETIEALRNELRSHGPDAHLLSALGNQYILGGYTELAPKWYEKALKISEENRAALYGLIRAYGEIGPIGKAKAAFRKYLNRYDDDAKVRRSFIDFLVEAEDYSAAAVQIERYVPRSRHRHYRRILALCYRECGRYLEASALYRMMLRDDPKNESYLRSLVFCLERSDQRKYAIDLVKQALTYLKPNVTLVLILGVLLYRDGQLEQSLKAFKRAGEMDPSDWRAPANIGKIYADKGLDAYANRYATKAESLKPGGGIA